MVKKVTHKELAELLKVYYEKKTSLLIYGSFGLGKSVTVRETAKKIAKERGREFIEWNSLTREEKQKVAEYPEKYFCLMDIRLSEYDSSDIKGLPDFKDGESIVWKSPFFAKVLEKENSDGILFFDEINLATPLVISSVYKIIYDRVINESKINSNWLILGCGNLSKDRAYTHELAPPVRDRGGEVELISPSADDWTDWAVANKIDSKIIGFINFKPSNLHKVDFEDEQKFTTERGWERLNNLIKGISDLKTLELVSSSAISEGVAKEFVAFCKIQDKVKLEEIIKNPEKLEAIKEISIKYFVITALAEKYKDDKVKFNKVIKISEVLDKMKNAEFVALLWRLCYRYDSSKFRKEFTGSEINKELAERYSKYLI